MYCEEPILKVYIGNQEYDDLDGANGFLDSYHDIAYHVTEGYRMVLETENHFLTLDVNGVSKLSKDSDITLPGECLEPCIILLENEPPWVEFETTLFVGEHLIEVSAEQEHFLLRFDDFTLKLIPYALGTMDKGLYNKNHWSYNHVYGCERLLKRKCSCGGEGEILLDFVSDYVVRCRKCKGSTWAGMNIQDAIDDWNAGEINCNLCDIKIE